MEFNLDLNFGVDGIVKDTSYNATILYSVYDSSENIISLETKNNTYIIRRYTSLGAVDNTFGGNGLGYIIPDLSGNNANFNNTFINIDSNNNIIILSETSYALYILRYTSNGNLDPTFNQTRTIFNSNKQKEITNMLIDQSGCIVIAGNINAGTFSDKGFLSRYDYNGNLDNSFGANGITIVNFRNIKTEISKIVLDSNGFIVASGKIKTDVNSSDTKAFISRFTSQGIIDSTFGSDGNTGFTIIDLIKLELVSIAFDSTGYIVASGRIEISQGLIHGAICRFEPNGNLDLNFGPEGNGIIINEALINGDLKIEQFLYVSIIDNNIIICSLNIVAIIVNNSFTIFSKIMRYNSSGELDVSSVTTIENFGLYSAITKTIGSFPLLLSGSTIDGPGILSQGLSLNGRASLMLYTDIIPLSSTCFLAKTPINTNQGIINIEDLDPKKHTIRSNKIEMITKTITQDKYLVCFEKDSLGNNLPSQKTIISKNHLIYYKGKEMKAKDFINEFENVYKIKYNGEILYNVLLKNHDKMIVNNLICETLHPENRICEFYKVLSTMSHKDQQIMIKQYNEYSIKNKIFSSKK
jgi:uncharacterized delta-60 repeat protein